MADYAGAQASVLGSMLIDADTVHLVMEALSPDDFDLGIGRDMFCAFRALFLMGEPIDPVTVLNRMGADSQTGRSYAMSLMDITPTAANVKAYIDIVASESRVKQIRALGMRLASELVTLDDAKDIVADLEGMMVDRHGVEALDMEQGLLNFYDELPNTPTYIPWNLDKLDENLKAEQSDYIILGGYPSDGKTALALSMAYHQASTLNVGFFSLETKASKLFNRIFTSVSGVSNTRLKTRTLTADDFNRLAVNSTEVRNRRLTLIKASSMTVSDIRAYSLAKRFDIIYIDYLTLIPDGGRSEYDRATNISKALHAVAQDCGITVVALSQLTRATNTKGAPQHPTMSSLRSSGQIEQDADAILLIYREDADELRSRRILRMAKNKEGVTGTWPLDFDGDLQQFTLAKPTPSEQYKAMEKGLADIKREQQISFAELPDDTPLPVEFGG